MGILISVAFVLAVARVIMANVLVDQSVEVAKVETQIEKISDQSEKITALIRFESSVSQITARSLALGFSSLNSYTYLPRPQNVAARFLFESR